LGSSSAIVVDKVSVSKRSEIMRAVKSRDSKIEHDFRRELWRQGFRYRKNASEYYGKPDIVLKKYKTVIFVDSCFWHGCPEHLRMPSSRQEYWNNKIRKNRKRDLAVNEYYKNMGWVVIRIWEHDLKNNADEVADRTVISLRMLAKTSSDSRKTTDIRNIARL